MHYIVINLTDFLENSEINVNQFIYTNKKS